MRASTVLVRDPGDRTLPAEFVPERRPFHRPQARYTVRLTSPADVDPVRKTGLAVSLFEPAAVEKLGYPLSFRPRLLLWEGLVDAVETTLPTTTFVDREGARDPKAEDLVVALLKVRRLAARQVVRLNRTTLDSTTLMERIFVERVLASASRVRLDDFVPGLPVIGTQLSRADLDREDSTVLSVGSSR
ncbi:MAG: hypothetical protein WB947_00555 [Thermoplasmata archaeon]